VTGIYQGILLFFLLAADLLIGYRIRFRAGPVRHHAEARS
jgi:hypothetical protein